MSNELYKEWLDFAKMDLASAEYLKGLYPVPLEIICYHCEQAAEKYLKAMLVYYGLEAPKTHDLIQLNKLCTQANAKFEEMVDVCIELSPYGVQVRYPANIELTSADMDCAIGECKKLALFVQKILAGENE